MFDDVTVAVAAEPVLLRVMFMVPSAVTFSEKLIVNCTLSFNFLVPVVGFSVVVIADIVGGVTSYIISERLIEL